MAINKAQLQKLSYIEKVIIHSHDLSLYLVSIILEGQEHYVVDKKSQPVRAFSKLELQSLFERHEVGEMVLRQQSAYDEMVGQPVREADNTLEVRLGNRNIGGASTQNFSVH